MVSAEFQALQEEKKGRFWAAIWKIKDIEVKHANLSLAQQRDIHAHGAKARFILAAVVQFRPSLHKFGSELNDVDIAQNGPSELLPVAYDTWQPVREAYQVMEDWLRRPGNQSNLNIDRAIANTERLAWCVQLFYEVIVQGGDCTPRLPAGETETFVEFCMRLHAHNAMMITANAPNGLRMTFHFPTCKLLETGTVFVSS